jgi:hypothetical protein
MASHSVLRFNGAEETAEYRAAVAKIILDIQHGTDAKTHVAIAEAIDVSLGTIQNAANMKSDLSATYLRRLGRVFGGYFLNPYIALVGGHFSPNEAVVDPAVLEAAAALIAWYGRAVHPDGPGGASIVYCELLEGEQPAELMRRHACAIIEAARSVRLAA